MIEKNKGIQDRFSIKFLEQLDKNFLLIEPPNKPMLLEYVSENKMPIGFLPKGIVTMIVGAGGVGKTHLLAQLVISVSTGTAWLDTFATTEHCGEGKKGNVFLGLGENQYDDIHRVLYKAAKKLRKAQSDLLKPCLLLEATKRIAPFSFCGQQAAFIEDKKPSLYFRQLKMKLMEMAPKDGWALIILDPISRLMGSDAETDNAAATQFIALLEELTIDLPGNPTILFAHHVNKSAINNEEKQNQTAARGASALTDGARQQLNLSKNFTSGLLQLTMTKSNFTKIMEAIALKQDFEGFVEHCSESVIKNKPKKSSQTYADEYAGG
ncbi:MAG: AAA family ATPase [Chlamydiales bacterium]|nr:AAA family ATPase [Chlamydiales bacterium]